MQIGLKDLTFSLGIFIVTLNVQLICGLKCFTCSSRNHAGCATLDFRVHIQECSEGHVCVKTIMYPNHPKFTNASSASIYNGIGVIRHCVQYSPNKGPYNKCIPKRRGHLHGETCFCNSTDLCNAGLNKLKGHGKVMAFCFLLANLLLGVIFKFDFR